MKLLTLTKYSYEGPSSRYRFYNYQEHFEAYNIEMCIKPLFGKSYFKAKYKWQKMLVAFVAYIKRISFIFWLLIFPKKYNLILLEYELLPYLPAWFEYLLTKRGVGYIVDYDDAIFHKYDRHSSLLVRSVLGDKIAKVMGYAQSVIVCNPYLEAYAQQYNKNVVSIPTVVQLERYKKVMQEYVATQKDTFVIGWIGSWTTGVYLLDILTSMKKFAQKYKSVRFHLVGFDETLLTKEEQRKANIDVITWSEESEIEDILGFDIGMMPLSDDAWSRGKCGFKLIQYMSCHKPVIASSVGVNSVIVEDGINGLLVQEHSQWYDAFERLYCDKELREAMAKRNGEKVEKYYNIAHCTQLYIRVLKQCCER